MNNILGTAMKSLREEKFPGTSMRRVGTTLSEKNNFGIFFYTQLNKIETGALVPSIDLLTKILEAYKATSFEKETVFQNFFVQCMLGTQQDVPLNQPAVDKALILYRSLKKK